MRTRLLPRRIALAALMTGSTLAGAHAAAADPSESVAPPPAGVRAPPATRPNSPTTAGATHTNSSDARSGSPENRTRATSAQHTDQPVLATHQPTSTRPQAGAHDAPTRSQSSASPVNRKPPALLPSQAARQAPTQAPPAARPADSQPPEPVAPPQVKDPDTRDAGPHADRTSRDRAER
jgi:hypothetical protein